MYFSVAIVLPTDWMKVVEIYTDIPLSSVLRKALLERAREFDQYQLAKYDKSITVTSKNRTFVVPLKKLTKYLHFFEPLESIMSLLGKKYSLTASEFPQSGLPGHWDPNMAGCRVRLPIPYTWEAELSSTLKAKHVHAWHDLIG
ncbi:hypothetical protein ACTXT7_014657, partial [Hymenolepis weldensis]